MQVAEAQQLVAIAYRQATLKWVMRIAGLGAVVLPVAAFATHSWIVAVTGAVVAAAVLLFISTDASSRVKRITGLPQPVQSRLWKRYRTDAPYAMRVKVALANDGLSRALDEITRSLNTRDATANARDMLSRD